MMKTVEYMAFSLKKLSNKDLMVMAKEAVTISNANLFIQISKELYSRGVSLSELKKLA